MFTKEEEQLINLDFTLICYIINNLFVHILQ